MPTALRSPLSWPVGWPRTLVRQRAKFAKMGRRPVPVPMKTAWMSRQADRVTVSGGVERLLAELRRLEHDGTGPLGVHRLIVTTNLRVPYSDSQVDPMDPGVAAYFTLEHRDIVLACDKWDRVADNLVAIALHVEAMRGMNRWGVGTLAQAFTGYLALPGADKREARMLTIGEEFSRE